MRRLTAILLALLAFAPAAAPAQPLMVIGAAAYTFVPGDDKLGAPITIEQGTPMLFVNSDPGGPHTVTADLADGGVPLFDTPYEVAPGGYAPVEGVENLAPGTYRFYCAVHYLIMWGTLVVT